MAQRARDARAEATTLPPGWTPSDARRRRLTRRPSLLRSDRIRERGRRLAPAMFELYGNAGKIFEALEIELAERFRANVSDLPPELREVSAGGNASVPSHRL